jgi:hypothetical protein
VVGEVGIHKLANLAQMVSLLKILILQIMEDLIITLILTSIGMKKIPQEERLEGEMQNLYPDGSIYEDLWN